MCEEMHPCAIIWPEPPKYKALTLLMLDCWQREYDKRPYRNFKFDVLDFEERMERKLDLFKDVVVIAKFLNERNLCTASIKGVIVLERYPKLIANFVHGLLPLRKIELKLMQLPRKFFRLINKNASLLNVKDFSLEGTPLTNVDVAELRMFMIKSRTLRYINVGFCNVTQFNFALIADGIHKSMSLRGFNCSRILGLHLSLDTEKIANIVGSLLWQNKLEEIVMQSCEFMAQDMDIFAEYIGEDCCKLLTLDLANNRIAADGAETLMRALVKGGNLKHLNIGRNGLGTHGGDSVAHLLSSCYRLEHLNIIFNEIDAEPINLILTANKKPVKLTRLELWGNQFDSMSAKVLRRLIDSQVVPQEFIDITYTYDATIEDYRVIPYV